MDRGFAVLPAVPGRAARMAVALLVVLGAVVGIAVWPSPDSSSASSARVRSTAPARLSASAQAAISRALGATETGFAVRRAATGFATRNAPQGFAAHFSDAGVTVATGVDRFRLSLTAVGYGDTLSTVSPAAPTAHANRVLYRRSGVDEWYANGPLGLEQGFTLSTAPVRRAPGPLTLVVHLSGDLQASLERGDHGISLSRGAQALLRYQGLSASDRTGRSLRAWMTLSVHRLLLHIDDRDARFPLYIDPFVQNAKLTASGGAANDGLGSSVAVSGDGSTVVVGASAANNYQGAVYVFERPTTGWAAATQTATLTASDGVSNDQLGESVSISANGSTIVASAPGADYQGNNGTGALYVYDQGAGGWSSGTQTAKLTLANGSSGDALGGAVSISGDGHTIADVGTYELQGGTTESVAYVYESSSTWSDQKPTVRLNPPGSDFEFNSAVSVSEPGTTIAVGGTGDVGGEGSGVVYVFTGSGASWTQAAVLEPSNPSDAEELGDTVAISADASTIAAGAPFANDGSAEGAVYVWVAPGTGWTTDTQTAELTASDSTIVSLLGTSVGVSSDGGAIVAGDPQSFYNQEQGTMYLFVRPASGWTNATQTQEFTSSDGVYNDRLGTAGAISADATTVVGGAPDATVDGHADQGAGYVWTSATPPGPTPLVTTGSATAGQTTATVSGVVNPNSSLVTGCQFDYGLTASYGSSVPCAQTAGAGSSGVNVSAALSGLFTGTTYHYRLEATNVYGTSYGGDLTFATQGASSPYAACSSAAPDNVHIQGIEVTQAVQTNAFPDLDEQCSPAPGMNGIHPSAQYPQVNDFNPDGTVRYVRLVAGRKTVVEVYAAETVGSSSRLSAPLHALLYAWRGGRLIGSTSGAPNPQAPDGGPLPLTSLPIFNGGVVFQERAETPDEFQFTIPDAWTHGDLTFVAQINPPGATPAVTECAGCQADDVFTLSGVQFVPTRPVFIRGVGVLESANEKLPPVSEVFAGLRAVLPVADDELRLPMQGYDGYLVGDPAHVCTSSSYADDYITQVVLPYWAPLDSYGPPGTVNRMEGIYSGNDTVNGAYCQPGATFPNVPGLDTLSSDATAGTYSTSAESAYSVAAATRPLTSVTHEIFHGLGLPHAGYDCVGKGGGQQGADWPPDNQGLLQGIGTDVWRTSGWSYDTIAPASPDAPASQQRYDLMSYCIANVTPYYTTNSGFPSSVQVWEHITWISPRNWDVLVDRLAVGGGTADPDARKAVREATRQAAPPSAHAAAASSQLHVLASGVGSGTTVDVMRGTPAGEPSSGTSPYRLVARNAAGDVVGEVDMAEVMVHREFQPSGLVLEGTVPGNGVDTVQIDAASGAALAQSSRPTHPLRVRILAPHRHQVIGRCGHGNCKVTVRWRISALDRIPLQSSLDYSPDGGRHWQTIFMGEDVSRATLPAEMLSRSRRAKVRVVVTDGWQTVTATSKAFRSLGAPPAVEILSPISDQQIADDGSLYLSGEAYDDAGQPLTGRRLRWYAGRRLLGTGQMLSVAGIPAGTRRITLEARDRYGRITRQSVRLHVIADRPQFLVLQAPKRLSAHAKRLTLRASVLAAANLTVSGHGVKRHRFKLGRRKLKISVRITPGHKPLRVQLELTSGPMHSLVNLVVTR